MKLVIFKHHTTKKLQVRALNSSSSVKRPSLCPSCTLYRVERLKKISFPLAGESLTHACSLKSTLHLRFQLESLNFFPGLVMQRWRLDETHVECPWLGLGQNPKPPHRRLLLRMLRVWILNLWISIQGVSKHALACHEFSSV